MIRHVPTVHVISNEPSFATSFGNGSPPHEPATSGSPSMNRRFRACDGG